MDWVQLIAIADSAYEWTRSRAGSMKLLIELSSKCAKGYISFYSLGSFPQHKSNVKIQWLRKRQGILDIKKTCAVNSWLI